MRKALHSLCGSDRLGYYHHPNSYGRADRRLAFSAWTMVTIIAAFARDHPG